MTDILLEENVLVMLAHDPSEVDNKNTELEEFWNSLHALQEVTGKGINKKHYLPTYSFEILSDIEGAKFFLHIPKRYRGIIAKKLNAVYPYIEVKDAEKDYLKNVDNDGYHTTSLELKLTENQFNSLKIKGAEKNFMNNLLNSMNHLDEETESSVVQVVIKPLPNGWEKGKTPSSSRSKFAEIGMKGLGIAITGAAIAVSGGKIGSMRDVNKKDNNNEEKKNEEIVKISKPCFNVSIRIISKSNDSIVARENAKSIAAVFTALDDKNTLRPVSINNFAIIKNRQISESKNNALNAAELAQFAHLPGSKVTADNLIKTSIKTPYDKNVPDKGIIIGNQSNRKLAAFPMCVISKETYQKVYAEYEKIIDNICKPRLILGQMGSGKSEWLINYAIMCIKFGLSIVVVDPKNDTQQRLIESIPKEYMHLVDYIDLGDLAFPAAMNLLRRRNLDDPTEASLIVTSLISFFKKEFGSHWGFAMQQLIQMTGNAILMDDVCTMYEFQLMLTSSEYRSKLINKMEQKLSNPKTKSRAMVKELLSFWKQYDSMKPSEQRAMSKSTMNKVGVFMANRLVRAIVSQKESYDFRKAGDEGRIVIINIPEGILTPENTKLLGSFINKSIWLDFQSRANISMQDRYPTVWLIEEAHEIIDEEFIGVLTKSRGYRLGATILTQGLTNFDNVGMKEIKELILTNCKNKILFRLGHQDAKQMAEEMGLTPFDLMNLPDYHFYGKILLENGKVSDTFFAKAPSMAPRLRSYDEYKAKHKSGKLTIDEIEDEMDLRHQLSEPISIYNMGIGNTEEDEEENRDKKKSKIVE